MKIINSLKVIILSLVIFNYSFAEIDNKEINELISKLEQNLKTYEVTKASSLLKENIEIIDNFIPILNTIAKEDKIELFSSLTDNLRFIFKFILWLLQRRESIFMSKLF